MTAMGLYTGMKRKKHFIFEFNEGQDQSEDHLRAKKHQSNAPHCIYISNGHCLGNDWSADISDENSDESQQMDTVHCDSSTITTTSMQSCSEDYCMTTSCSETYSDHVLNYGHVSTESNAQYRSKPLLQQHSMEGAISLSSQSKAALRCSECAAGKSKPSGPPIIPVATNTVVITNKNAISGSHSSYHRQKDIGFSTICLKLKVKKAQVIA